MANQIEYAGFRQDSYLEYICRFLKPGLISRIQVSILLFIATSYHIRECFHFVVYSLSLLPEIDVIFLFDHYLLVKQQHDTNISYDYITEYMTK